MDKVKEESNKITPVDLLDTLHQNLLVDDNLINKELKTIAKDNNIDITLYSLQGKKIISTSNIAYENEWLADNLNPIAFHNLMYHNESQTVLEDKIGTLDYFSAYTCLKSAQGKKLGIIQIPLYNSKLEIPVVNLFGVGGPSDKSVKKKPSV